LKHFVKPLVARIPKGRSWLHGRRISEPQPSRPRAHVVISMPTDMGPSGKMSAHFYIGPFCDTLRSNGFATHVAGSERELRKILDRHSPVVLIHVYGEDDRRIDTPGIADLERRCALVFNRSAVGPVLADKAASQELLSRFGVPMPPCRAGATDGFQRARYGSAVKLRAAGVGAGDAEVETIRTQFVDTRVEVRGKAYFTTVRLLCVGAEILHAYPRARPTTMDTVDLDAASVHAKDTPLDADLVEALTATLVVPNMEAFRTIATRCFEALGHGFFAHDLLISVSGEVFLCEAGFKFDDPAFWRRFEPLKDALPSHAILFPAGTTAEAAALAVVRQCRSVLGA
jgi:hypothetical protein